MSTWQQQRIAACVASSTPGCNCRVEEIVVDRAVFAYPSGEQGAYGTAEEERVGVNTVVWTDGSCNANGMHGRGGWAALIEQAGTVREMYGSADGTTQHRMELTAVCEALETLTGAIEVRTDTPYVEKCFNQNWHARWLRDGSWKGSNGRPVKNRDLWERLFGLVWDDGRRDVTFVRIRGHAGEANNDRVDRLARAAALSAG